MLGVESNADFFADRVIVMARHQRQDFTTAGKPQRVDEIAAAESLAHDFCLQRTGVVMHDVVRSKQHIDARAAV